MARESCMACYCLFLSHGRFVYHLCIDCRNMRSSMTMSVATPEARNTRLNKRLGWYGTMLDYETNIENVDCCVYLIITLFGWSIFEKNRFGVRWNLIQVDKVWVGVWKTPISPAGHKQTIAPMIDLSLPFAHANIMHRHISRCILLFQIVDKNDVFKSFSRLSLWSPTHPCYPCPINEQRKQKSRSIR